MQYEFVQFLNNKVLEYLPPSKVKVGDRWNFRCPICGDSKKSSTKKRAWWYNSTASFYCFNCSTGLSGIKFIEAISGSQYKDIRKEYIKLVFRSGVSPSLSSVYEFPSNAYDLFNIKPIVKPEWKTLLSDEARTYLNSRLVLSAPFLKDPLYSWKSKKNLEYILIPWVINGVQAYFQLNDYAKHGSIKYIFPKNRKKLIYGLDNIDIDWPYIICFEGVYDSLFVKNGVATGTKAITQEQINLIKCRYPNHTIVISFDNDLAGKQSMIKYINANSDFKYFIWFKKNTPQKDINEYVISQNNTQVFADAKLLNKMIFSSLQAKLLFMKNKWWGLSSLRSKQQYGNPKL